MAENTRKLSNRAEAAFAKLLDQAGKTYFYHPRSFKIPAGSYQPDFYVVEDACFYEVVGTHQAYSYNREKIEEFRITYPQHRLEIVNGGAWKTGPGVPRVASPRPARRGRPLMRAHGDVFAEHTPLLDAIRPLLVGRIRTVAELARALGVGYPSLYGALVNPKLGEKAVQRWTREIKEALA